VRFRAGSKIEGQNLTQNSNKIRVYPFPKKDILLEFMLNLARVNDWRFRNV